MYSKSIKTVLKSGGDYSASHVVRMRDMMRQYVRADIDFICYSDIPIDGVNTEPLLNNWPGWWSKLEIFRDAGDSFYIDLDMTINADITDIVMYSYDFAALSNMNPSIDGIGSAIMAWSGDKTFLYENFRKNSELYMRLNRKIGTKDWGDQGYIYSQIKSFQSLQELYPNRISSFKNNGKSDIVVYYGVNRPWGVNSVMRKF